MNRREFLQGSLLSGSALITHEAAAALGAATPAFPPFAFAEWTLSQLQRGMETGELTSAQITEAYWERIGELDRQGPRVNSLIELNPEAMDLARALDQERRSQGARGPLHGIPVLVKDNLDTGDRMQTTAGSLALVGPPAPRDAFVVERLRAAGAVLLGKTNLSEWANFRSANSISGWSARGGLTRNPYALDRSAAGSSTGSAAAVSANFAAVAVGTETDGSIVAPATYCGIVGLKPTLGWVSRSGIIPIAASQDTAGPMTRTVTDAALLLSAIAAVDPRDAATNAPGRPATANFQEFLRPEALRGARIGVARDFFRPHRKMDPVIAAALEALRSAGAVLVDPVRFPDRGNIGEAEFEVMLYEFKAGLNAYLATRGPELRVKSLADVIAFNEREAARELRLFDQDILLRAAAKGSLNDDAYREARKTCLRRARTEGIDAVMDEHRLDALVAPTGGPAHLLDPVNGDRWQGGSSSLAAVAGYPNITVPCGTVVGLPVGLSFFGRAWSDARLLGFAFAFEQATRARTPPTFQPTIAPAE